MNKEPNMKSTTAHEDQFAPEPTPQEEEAWREMERRQSAPVADQAQPKRPYNPSGSLSEYGVIPECDAPQPVSGADAAQAQTITPDDAKVCAEALRNGMSPTAKMFIPAGWNTLLDKLDAIADSAPTQQPVSGAKLFPISSMPEGSVYALLEDGASRDSVLLRLKRLLNIPKAQPSGSADEPEWLQRLRLEARDLSDNLDRLSRFRDTAGYRMLTDTDQGLIARQGNQMHALLQTLNQRIHSGAGQHRRSKRHD